jgi:hypothetical protein
MAPRPLPTVEPQQPMFLRLANSLRFSPRTNTVCPGQNDQPRDPLDVCFFLLLHSYSTRHSCRSFLPRCRYPALSQDTFQLRGVRL